MSFVDVVRLIRLEGVIQSVLSLLSGMCENHGASFQQSQEHKVLQYDPVQTSA